MDKLRAKTEEILKEVLKRAKKANKKSGFCIGNTRKVDANGYFFSPIRETSLVVAGSIIVSENIHSREVAKIVDGNVDYIFVDTEKKITPKPGKILDLCNIETEVKNVVKKTPIHTFKGNDMTVESVDTLLAQIVPNMGGLKVAIIGAGNLGSKLGLKLVERGAHVILTRRDAEKLSAIVKALNLIKPDETVATVRGTTNNLEAAHDVDILIGTSTGYTPSITKDLIDVVAKNAIIMDGGKGCITQEAVEEAERLGLDIYRFNVMPGFDGAVAQILRMESILRGGVGRKEIKGVPVVSVGLLARKDEVIVDCIKQPKVIFGVAAGQGDLVRKLNDQQKEKLRILEGVIQ